MAKQRALGFKQLACKECGNIVQKVDEKADAITCSNCVQRQLAGPLWIDVDDYFRELNEKLSKEE
jgi:DNA-directed RNA polymerase subunit RPC12/RpoP